MEKELIYKYSIIVLFTSIILFCFVFLEFKLFTNYKEKLNYYYLAKYMSDNSSEEVFETASETQRKLSNEKTEKMLKLEELHSQNEDVVAWIEIPRN